MISDYQNETQVLRPISESVAETKNSRTGHFLQSVNFSLLHVVLLSCNKGNVVSWYKALKVIAIQSSNFQVNILCYKIGGHFGLLFIISNMNWQEMCAGLNAYPKIWRQTCILPVLRHSYKTCCWNRGESKLKNKWILMYFLLLCCILILQLVYFITYVFNDNWHLRIFMILILIFIMDFWRKKPTGLGQPDLPMYDSANVWVKHSCIWFMQCFYQSTEYSSYFQARQQLKIAFCV